MISFDTPVEKKIRFGQSPAASICVKGIRFRCPRAGHQKAAHLLMLLIGLHLRTMLSFLAPLFQYRFHHFPKILVFPSFFQVGHLIEGGLPFHFDIVLKPFG